MSGYELKIEVEAKNESGRKMSKTTHEIYDLEYADLVAVEAKMVGGIFGGLLELGKEKLGSSK